MLKTQRKVINRLVREACAEIGEEILKEVEGEKERKWVKKWVARREKYGASNTLLRELAAEDPRMYKNVLRMNSDRFDMLLEMVAPKISKQDSAMRMAIPCKTKLEVTLRYMASGDSLHSLALLFRVPRNTISTFLPNVLQAIYDSLTPYIKVSLNYNYVLNY